MLIAFAASDPERRIVLLIPLPVELRLRTIGRVALIVSAVLGIATVVFRGSPNGVVQQVTGVAHFAHLGGGLFGLLFMRLQGYRDGRLTRGDILRGREGGGLWGRVARKPRPRNPPVERSRPREEVEYDAILDKMNRHGIQSLSESERAILERASERIRSREKRS